MSTIATSGVAGLDHGQQVVGGLAGADDVEARCRSAAARCPPGAARCPRRSRRARDLRPDSGPAADRRPDAEPATERLHPIGQAAQAGPGFGVGPADTVILDLDDDLAVVPLRP